MENETLQTPAENRFAANTSSQNLVPGGFWYRFLAIFIDAIIIGIVQWPVSFAIVFIFSGTSVLDPDAINTSGYLFAQLLSTIATWTITAVYYIYFYTKRGATPGKMIFSLKVVDERTGKFLTPGRIILREILGKLVSALLLFIGYLMAAFRKDKKALHDIIAGSQVWRQIT